MHPILLLWDIDGTLVTTDRAGERALTKSVKELYQTDLGDTFPVDLRGRTDRAIARDLFSFLKKEHHEEELALFSRTYLKNLEKMMPLGQARVLAGVHHALAAVAEHKEIHQGLLTGNYKAGAEIKLTFLGIWKYFEFGAFADDSADRNELGPIAVERAQKHLKERFSPDRVVVIGDTPRDVECGKVIGAKTIAVATGAFSYDQLAETMPTLTLRDLSDTQAFICWLEATVD